MRALRSYAGLISALAAIVVATAVWAADPVGDALDAMTQANEAAARSQDKINRLADETRKLHEAQRAAATRVEQLKPYLAEMRTKVAQQAERKAMLQRQVTAAGQGRFDVAPLLVQMTDSLERFVAADIPYIPDERRRRVQQLRDRVASLEASDPAKLRDVLEAWQVEIRYGRTLEAYPGELKFGAETVPVEFLRVGRVMLFYVADKGRQGYWDRSTRQWRELPESERSMLEQAFKVVRGDVPPEFLALPMPAAPEGA